MAEQWIQANILNVVLGCLLTSATQSYIDNLLFLKFYNSAIKSVLHSFWQKFYYTCVCMYGSNNKNWLVNDCQHSILTFAFQTMTFLQSPADTRRSSIRWIHLTTPMCPCNTCRQHPISQTNKNTYIKLHSYGSILIHTHGT